MVVEDVERTINGEASHGWLDAKISEDDLWRDELRGRPKAGQASDSVVGPDPVVRGYVAQDLPEPGQSVRGVIIALEDDIRIRRALAVAPNIDFYRYEVNFRLRRA